MQNENSIGVFDSGIGGLTFVKEIKKIMPNENIIYFGDTGRVPYGSKSRETVLKYTSQIVNFLKSKNVKIIVAACGTVSSVLPSKTKLSERLFGVIEPTCKAASKDIKTSKIGVIATQGAINSGVYEKTLKKINPDTKVFSKACPLFVPLIENGITSNQNLFLKEILKTYLFPLKRENIDTLILGCTHYPLIKKAISDFFEGAVTLVDSGEETAKHTKKLLENLKLENKSENLGTAQFFVSDLPQNFSESGTNFLGYDISKIVKKIDLNEM